MSPERGALAVLASRRMAAFNAMGEATEGSVERQVRAYNEHNIDEFMACFAEDVVIEDADGSVLMRGRSRCESTTVESSIASPISCRDRFANPRRGVRGRRRAR